jgi:hypothetical protein
VSNEIAGLSAAFAERMRELRTGPTDPRLAPMLAQLQALMRQHVAGATPAVIPLAEEYVVDLPVELTDLLSCYLGTCPARAFAQAATLSESDAGRRILDLSPADRVRMVVAAYHAWAAVRWGGSRGGGLRRVVSDLLRAKLPLTDATGSPTPVTRRTKPSWARLKTMWPLAALAPISAARSNICSPK